MQRRGHRQGVRCELHEAVSHSGCRYRFDLQIFGNGNDSFFFPMIRLGIFQTFSLTRAQKFWDSIVYINMESNTKKKRKNRGIPSQTWHFARMHLNFIEKVISLLQLVSRIVYDSSDACYMVCILGACTSIYRIESVFSL
jgi:hypothetical protein